MKTFKVDWKKTFVKEGTTSIKATSRRDAEDKLGAKIDDVPAAKVFTKAKSWGDCGWYEEMTWIAR